MEKINFQNLYDFLRLAENKKFNNRVRSTEINSWFVDCKNDAERLTALLWKNYYSQSSPRLNLFRNFFDKLRPCVSTLSLGGGLPLVDLFNNNCLFPAPLDSLLQTLAHSGNGWGEKTSALFFKSLRFAATNNMIVLDEKSTEAIHQLDNVRLPVDKVIEHIFVSDMVVDVPANKFSFLNSGLIELKCSLNPNADWASYFDDWDELWFWGFINQNIDKKVRFTNFNKAKLLSLNPNLFDDEEIASIEKKSSEFRKILEWRNQ